MHRVGGGWGVGVSVEGCHVHVLQEPLHMVALSKATFGTVTLGRDL